MLAQNVGEELGTDQDGHQLVAVHIVLVHTLSLQEVDDLLHYKRRDVGEQSSDHAERESNQVLPLVCFEDREDQ